MKPFRFQKFEIQQSPNVFRVGTDAVLLGAVCSAENVSSILEVGTGTGVISLMLAQRNLNARITAIDIDENAVNLSRLNFENSPFSSRLKSLLADFKNFEPHETFDFIVSNPPYFQKSESSKDVVARQTLELDFRQLISQSVRVLSKNGFLSVILPTESEDDFVEIAKHNRLFLVRKITVFGIVGGKPKRNILEFSFLPKNFVEEIFTIEDSPRKYSRQYLESTKHFHIFER